ncbi:MAG: substrate-binding domain-containing protein [Massilia sp.]
MNRRQAGIALAVGAGTVGIGALLHRLLVEAEPAPTGRQSLLIGGAGAMMALNTSWARAFMRSHPEIDIVIEKGGSLPAYIAASRGAIDLAAMTRSLSDAEDDASAHHFLVARGDVGIVVQRGSPLRNLGREQVRGLLTGEIGNWRQVGGPARTVKVYAHARGGIARQFAEEFLLDGSDFAPAASECDSDASLIAAVAADPDGIGAIGAREQIGAAAVRCVEVDGVAATRATVLSGRYPYAHSFYLLLYGEQDGLRADFLAFARSAAGQEIVRQAGLVAVC